MKISDISMLWFDVENGYKTTYRSIAPAPIALWFDVENGYKTTLFEEAPISEPLWFDVENGYKTTKGTPSRMSFGCGLM